MHLVSQILFNFFDSKNLIDRNQLEHLSNRWLTTLFAMRGVFMKVSGLAFGGSYHDGKMRKVKLNAA